MSIILKGIGVGFSIAAPVGAIGLLCIQQTLRGGISLGIASGLGAATADMMYGILVACGLKAMQGIFLSVKTPLSIMGGLFLCYLGIKKFFVKVSFNNHHTTNYDGLLKAYILTFFLTLTNPATILDFMALFTGLSINVAHYYEGLTFVLGVFLGSAFWWFLLCFTVGLLRKKISKEALQCINYIAGVAIFSFGIYALTKHGINCFSSQATQ